MFTYKFATAVGSVAAGAAAIRLTHLRSSGGVGRHAMGSESMRASSIRIAGHTSVGGGDVAISGHATRDIGLHFWLWWGQNC